MNRKGFTLVEILATLVVLGILIAIAVPNIAGIIANNKQSVGKEDVVKMVSGTRARIKRKDATYPLNENDCKIFTLDYIDINDDYDTGINGGKYDRYESFVIVSKRKIEGSTNKYEYKFYIRMIEEKNGKMFEIQLAENEAFEKDSRVYISPNSSAPPRKIGVENATTEEEITALNDEVNKLFQQTYKLTHPSESEYNLPYVSPKCNNITQIYK